MILPHPFRSRPAGQHVSENDSEGVKENGQSEFRSNAMPTLPKFRASIRSLPPRPPRARRERLKPSSPRLFTLVARGRNIGHSVRTDRWRYIEWNGGADGSELYDHERDAQEMYNVAGDARHAQVTAGMKAALKQANLAAK